MGFLPVLKVKISGMLPRNEPGTLGVTVSGLSHLLKLGQRQEWSVSLYIETSPNVIHQI
jgi:hypothetical protein